MRENDVRAVVEILEEIEHDRVLYPGFERLLMGCNYPDIKSLRRTFQKICDIMDEWESPRVELGLMQEIQCCMLDVEKERVEIRLAVAGNYYEFMCYCRENRINPSTIQYIPDLDHIRGYRDCKILLIHGHTGQQDFFEIKTYCDAHNIERIWV